MENFKNNFYPKKDGREVISNIFPNEGRTAFSKKVKDAFEWSKKGGPRVGTPSFFKAIAGNLKLNPEELSVLKKEINKEINKIKKERESEPKLNIKESTKEESDYKKISEDAKKDFKEELKRSGGIDPNEI